MADETIPNPGVILAVDDDASILESLKHTLEPRGYKLRCHSRAGEALDATLEDPPELFLCGGAKQRIKDLSLDLVPDPVQSFHQGSGQSLAYLLA